jgi:hypothetical protein
MKRLGGHVTRSGAGGWAERGGETAVFLSIAALGALLGRILRAAGSGRRKP